MGGYLATARQCASVVSYAAVAALRSHSRPPSSAQNMGGLAILAVPFPAKLRAKFTVCGRSDILVSPRVSRPSFYLETHPYIPHDSRTTMYM